MSDARVTAPKQRVARVPMRLWGLWMFLVWRWRLGYWDTDALAACWRAPRSEGGRG